MSTSTSSLGLFLNTYNQLTLVQSMNSTDGSSSNSSAVNVASRIADALTNSKVSPVSSTSASDSLSKESISKESTSTGSTISVYA